MLVVDVVDGVSERFLLLSCGWLAGRQLEKNPLNKMYSTLLLPPVYNNNTPKKSAKSIVAYGWSCCYPPYFDAASGCTTYMYTYLGIGGNFEQ